MERWLQRLEAEPGDPLEWIEQVGGGGCSLYLFELHKQSLGDERCCRLTWSDSRVDQALWGDVFFHSHYWLRLVHHGRLNFMACSRL